MMTNDMRNILELPSNLTVQSGQQQNNNLCKIKTGTYKKLPQYPFSRDKQKIQMYKSYFTDQVIPEHFPPYTNLVQSEHFQQQEAIYEIIGPIKPIIITEMQYNAHLSDNYYFCSYGKFMEIIEMIFKYQFNFTIAADRLDISVYNLFIQFYNYCNIIQSSNQLQLVPKNGQHDYMRCIQAVNYFLNVASDFEKLTSLIDKNAEENEQQEKALLNVCKIENELLLDQEQVQEYRGKLNLKNQQQSKDKMYTNHRNIYKELLQPQEQRIPTFSRDTPPPAPAKTKHNKQTKLQQNLYYVVDLYQYFPYSLQPFEDEQVYELQEQREDVVSYVTKHIGNKTKDAEIDVSESQFNDCINYSTLQANIKTD